MINRIQFADGAEHNSYIRRTSWITPEYMLSGIAVDPNREYLAVNQQARLAGVSFSTGADDRIAVLGNTNAEAGMSEINTVTGKDCLIVGRMPQANSVETLVYVSDGVVWKSRAEDPSGWQFFQAGNGFCALRLGGAYAIRDATHSGYHLVLKDRDTPLVIQTGRLSDYPGGLTEFKQAVRAKAKFDFTGNGLSYRSLDGDAYKFWVREKRMPESNGKPFNLNPRDTYSSPYLTMVHGSDVAIIKYPGYPDLRLDFSYNSQPGKLARE
jgi:hypothetical protein